MLERFWPFVGTSLLALAPLHVVAQTPSPGQLVDPILESLEESRLALVVEEFAAFSKSNPNPLPTDARLQRHARINHFGELPDGSGRFYVPDLNGMLSLIVDGTIKPYLDVGTRFEPDFFASAGMGSGFGFVAFHPEFASNGLFYTVHTEADGALTSKIPDLTPQPNSGFHGVVTEWRAANPAADTFEGTSREVLRLGFWSRIHGIQQIGFNPTVAPGAPDYGLLYLGVGDGGYGFNTSWPQDLDKPQGKILRIDPRGSDAASGKYGIPIDNPFVGRAGVLGEIYAYGLRDPHRFSWDSGGEHRMFLGHIGEKDIEMVADVLPGDNFGWSEREGRFTYDAADRCYLRPLPPDDATNGYVYPLAEYDHNRPPELACGADAGHAVSGGFVYRGPVAALRGKYIFGDLVDGRVMYIDGAAPRDAARRAPIHELTLSDGRGRELSMPQLTGDARVDLRFGVDSKQDLYLLSKANGKVYKVTGVETIAASDDVFPSLRPNLVAHYDFDHPDAADPARERDQGRSGTDIALINGGAAMRVQDPAYAAAGMAMAALQQSSEQAGNDDWKAGVYDPRGVDSLAAFSAARGITIMTWVKMLTDAPMLDTNTPDPQDRYASIGLAALLSGDSEGHAVRAMVEVTPVGGTPRLSALGRRIDGGRSQIFASSEPWQTLLPKGTWVHLAATFDYASGTMKLYRNGRPLAGSYASSDDPWQVAAGGDLRTSPTNPRGIKLGGSFPQNTAERNPGQCHLDGVMFLDRAATQLEIEQQYRRASTTRRAN